MSDEKFTKGDWRVNYSYSTFLQIDTKSGSAICEVDADTCIAAYDEIVSSPTQEQLSNAHLIAAAPEMYAMLKFLVENDSINDHSIDREVLTLLAKARGES